MTNELETILATLITKLGDTAQTHGPAALALLGRYEQYTSIGKLVVGGLCGFISGAVGYFGVKTALGTKDTDDGNAAIVLLAFVLSGGFLIAWMCLIFNPATWIAALSPDMALVKMAVDAVKK